MSPPFLESPCKKVEGKRKMIKNLFEELKVISEENFQYVDIGEKFDVSINCIEKGAVVPPHTHDQEVFNYVFDGEFSVSIEGGEHKSYKKGDWINIKAGVVHSVEAKSEVSLLELWRK